MVSLGASVARGARSPPSGVIAFGLRARSREDPAGSAVEEGSVQVGTFMDPRAELVPRTSRGSRGGTHEIAVDNRGNARLSAEIEALVSSEVNPALAAHGGFVTYVGHDGEGTAYMTMGGGCHGCSMSKMTMLEGVQTMLSEALPAVQRVKDLTDHTTGENPYYS